MGFVVASVVSAVGFGFVVFRLIFIEWIVVIVRLVAGYGSNIRV